MHAFVGKITFQQQYSSGLHDLRTCRVSRLEKSYEKVIRLTSLLIHIDILYMLPDRNLEDVGHGCQPF